MAEIKNEKSSTLATALKQSNKDIPQERIQSGAYTWGWTI